jgi:hypothetical protein
MFSNRRIPFFIQQSSNVPGYRENFVHVLVNTPPCSSSPLYCFCQLWYSLRLLRIAAFPILVLEVSGTIPETSRLTRPTRAGMAGTQSPLFKTGSIFSKVSSTNWIWSQYFECFLSIRWPRGPLAPKDQVQRPIWRQRDCHFRVWQAPSLHWPYRFTVRQIKNLS